MVIDGAAAAPLTVRVATLLVTLPVELLTVTVNWLPLSEVVVAGTAQVANVAPLMGFPFFLH